MQVLEVKVPGLDGLVCKGSHQQPHQGQEDLQEQTHFPLTDSKMVQAGSPPKLAAVLLDPVAMYLICSGPQFPRQCSSPVL